MPPDILTTPVFPFAHNWTEPVVERLEFLTGVMRSAQGYEQRRALRDTPRRTIEANFTGLGDVNARLKLWLRRFGGGEFFIPLWHNFARLTQPAEAGRGTLHFDTKAGEFRTGGFALLRRDEAAFEPVKLGALEATGASISSPLDRSWPAGTRVFPLEAALAARGPAAYSEPSAAVGRMRLAFLLTGPQPFPGGEVPLVNPDAANGIEGWTVVSGAFAAREFGGRNAFYAGDGRSDAEMRQDAALPPDSAGLTLTATWYQASFEGRDEGALALVFLDASGVKLAEAESPYSTINADQRYERRRLIATIPWGAATVRVTLKARYVATNNTNAYFSEIRLLAEPPSAGARAEYRDAEILLAEPNRAEEMRSAFERIAADLDAGVGPRSRSDEAGRAFATRFYDWWADTREKRLRLRRDLYRLDGRRRAIWMPSFAADITLTRDFEVAQRDIEREDAGTANSETRPRLAFRSIGYGYAGERLEDAAHILFRRASGEAPVMLRIADILATSGGEDIVTIHAETPATLAAGERGEFAELMRLNQDSIEITHRTANGLTTAAASFRGFRDGRDASGPLTEMPKAVARAPWAYEFRFFWAGGQIPRNPPIIIIRNLDNGEAATSSHAWEANFAEYYYIMRFFQFGPPDPNKFSILYQFGANDLENDSQSWSTLGGRLFGETDYVPIPATGGDAFGFAFRNYRLFPARAFFTF